MRAMLFTPFATVLPMSCSFRSRKTCLPASVERAREIEPAGKAELIADLVEHDRIAEPRHHRLRLGDGGDIEGDDQALAGIEHVVQSHRTYCA